MAVFLDTGFLLAVKNKDDKNFQIAQSWMRRFLKNEFGEIFTSTLVFNELVSLALLRIKRPDFAINLGKYLLVLQMTILRILGNYFKNIRKKDYLLLITLF